MIRVHGQAAGGVAARRGMSLIEVMLGLAIMLLSLVAITRLVEIGSDRAMEARLQVRGTRLAQAKLAEVEAGAVPLDSASSGTGEQDDKDWSWTVDPQPQTAPNLYMVTVKLSRTLRGTPFEVSLSQMVFDPTKMGTAAQAEKPPDPTTTDGTTGGTAK